MEFSLGLLTWLKTKTWDLGGAGEKTKQKMSLRNLKVSEPRSPAPQNPAKPFSQVREQLQNWAVVALAFNPSIWEVKAGGSL